MQMGTLPLRELSDLPSNIQAEIQSIALGLLEFSLGLFALSSLATLPICPLGHRTGANPLCSTLTGEHSVCLPRGTSGPLVPCAPNQHSLLQAEKTKPGSLQARLDWQGWCHWRDSEVGL